MNFINSFYFMDFVQLIILFATISLITVIIQLVRRESIKEILIEWILPVFSMSVVALSVGLLSGNSREPVVGALVPAFLSLISGFMIYLFSTNSSHKITASLFSLVFAVFLILGISSGANNRDIRERSVKEWEQKVLGYETDMELYKLRVIKEEELYYPIE